MKLVELSELEIGDEVLLGNQNAIMQCLITKITAKTVTYRIWKKHLNAYSDWTSYSLRTSHCMSYIYKVV